MFKCTMSKVSQYILNCESASWHFQQRKSSGTLRSNIDSSSPDAIQMAAVDTLATIMSPQLSSYFVLMSPDERGAGHWTE